MIVTIDTNILAKAFREMETDYLQLVTSIDGEQKISHDYDGVINREYQNNVGDSLAFSKWYQRLYQLQAIHYCSGQLPRRYKSKLSRLGCHEASDHVFIAVAYHSDKILFTEDSDMGKGPKGNEPPHDQALAYLQGTMELIVCNVHEALALLKR